jgi:hypothetical protein
MLDGRRQVDNGNMVETSRSLREGLVALRTKGSVSILEYANCILGHLNTKTTRQEIF